MPSQKENKMSGQSDADLRRLKLQQDHNSAAIQQMKMQLQQQGARRAAPQHVEDDDDNYVPPENLVPRQTQQAPQGPQYQQVDPNVAMVNHIIAEAGKHAANHVANQTVQQAQVQGRMTQLMEKFPALREDDHPLTIRARDEYARIEKQNPGLDKATAYELAAAEAASFLGLRPANSSLDEYMQYDYTMSAGNSGLSSSPKKGTKSRLTKPIVTFADALGIPVDARTPEGKKALAELNEYTERFKADKDESEYKYK